MKNFRIVYSIMTGIMLPALASSQGSVMPPEQNFTLALRGESNGGELVITNVQGQKPVWTKVETRPGESAVLVAERVADALRDLYDPRGTGRFSPRAENGVIDTSIYRFTLAGSETGLGIPSPPLGLTGFYSPEVSSVTLSWEIPDDDTYDAIHVTGQTHMGPLDIPMPIRLPGDTTSVKVRYGNAHPDFRWLEDWESPHYVVWGTKEGVPSAQVGIEITESGIVESFAHPFSRGIMPNWTLWQGSPVAGIESRASAFTSPTLPMTVRTRAEKSLFAILNPPAKGRGGMARPMPGLEDVQLLQVGLQLHLPATVPNETPWSIEFHAVPRSYAECINAEVVIQVPLDGDSLLGRIDQSSGAPSGEWFEWSSKQGGKVDSLAPIEIPEGVNSIMLFLALAGPEDMEIGVDWFTAEVLVRR